MESFLAYYTNKFCVLAPVCGLAVIQLTLVK